MDRTVLTPRQFAATKLTLAATLAYAAAVLLLTYIPTAKPDLAIYALSFWHYYAYLLACLFAAVPLQVFKRDAILLKSISLTAFAYAYLSAPFDAVSAATMAAGFALNTAGAVALGSDRTYYGYEIAGLAPLQITSFPYSLTSHPMLIGNALAYGGSLLNPAFREAWWPLACTHIALNLALIAMEARLSYPPGVKPTDDPTRTRRHHSFAILSLPFPAMLGVSIWWAAGGAEPHLAAYTAVAGFLLSAVFVRVYGPAPLRGAR